MKSNLIIFITSFLFGAGLEISQMNNPQKVYGFLNIFRNWDPSLGFVMFGAVFINALAFQLIKEKRIKKNLPPLMGKEFILPKKDEIDKRLITGALIFGAGWGLAGFCPGPAISGLFRNQKELYIMAGSMMIGMFIYSLVERFILDKTESK